MSEDRLTEAPAPPDLLAAIVAATEHAVTEAAAALSLSELERRTADAPGGRGERFRDALSTGSAPRVIAECKRRSPSRGVLRADYDPVDLARGYAAAGAAAISVLTEPAFFDGALDHLERVRAAVDVPLLRKDFVVTDYQVVQARACGADAVLLIVAALDDHQLRTLLGRARALGLAALVEVHDRPELDRALAAGAEIIGVNNRNLRTLKVALDASYELVAAMPESVVAVAESGLRDASDLRRLRSVGYDAFLIGEAFMTRPLPGAALEGLLEATGPGTRGSRASSGAEA